MTGIRVSKWKRTEVIKLLETAGWSIRTGGEGHTIAQKGEERITLGSDPINKNAVSDVERALGVHIEKVIRKQKGRSTSVRQLEQRFLLAKRMDAAGFDSKTVMKQCSLGGLYTYGFRYHMIRGTESEQHELAVQINKSRMEKKGVKVKQTKTFQIEKPAASSSDGDLSAMLELLSSIESKVDSAGTSSIVSGRYMQRLQSALVEAGHLKAQLGKVSETVDRIMNLLDIKKY